MEKTVSIVVWGVLRGGKEMFCNCGRFRFAVNYKCDRVLKTLVRVKGGMSLRGNGIWHGLQNGIVMQNLIYAE